MKTRTTRCQVMLPTVAMMVGAYTALFAATGVYEWIRSLRSVYPGKCSDVEKET